MHWRRRSKKKIDSVEQANFVLLPGNFYLRPSIKVHSGALPVQPDGIISSETAYAVIEAKRLKSSSFQPQQLAREYLLAIRDAGDRVPLLLLIVGKEPPVRVQKHGLQSVRDAVFLHLKDVYDQCEDLPFSFADAAENIDSVICWTMWQSVSESVAQSLRSIRYNDPSITATVRRLANSAIEAIEWHRG